MRVIIDRFEGNYAVCEKENRDIINIKKNNIPKNAKEGDVLSIDGHIITIDIIETEARKKQIQEVMDDLWN